MNEDNTFRIILRYGLDPFNGLQENLKQLKRFAEESTINEVMFLLAPEERSTGHPTIEQATPWMEGMLQAKTMLAEIGVQVSINPWTTTYHTGRGRQLHPGQDFRLMVGETGADNGMTACPLCENWQDYLNTYFSWIAKELDPVALWVEDDWRLHNHGGEMGYGGCFCDHCMTRFSSMVGREVSREELVARVSQPGPPHELRGKWIDFAQLSLAEPAESLAKALRSVRPNMRLGFMTSIPDIQSIEGRDWNQLMDIWTEDGERYLIRPHMPPYTEEPPIVTSPGYSRQTIATLDKSADIYPELENSPRCGQYSGSHTYSAWEMFNAVCYGSRGITINHFDNMGMNTYYDRGFGKALAKHRPTFDALMPLNIDDRKARGVKILFSPDVARQVWTGGGSAGKAKMYTGEDLSGLGDGGGSLDDLQANSVAWSKVFYPLGISHSFTRSLDSEAGDIFAVSDQTLRCFPDDEIRNLLSKNVILDLASADILVERGFGGLIGIESVDRTKLKDSAYSIEEVEPAFFGELDGGVRARMCAQRCADPIGKFAYSEGVNVLSQIKDADLNTLFPGSGIFQNELGGRIFTSVYPLGGAQFYMAYFSVVRQEYWTKVLFDLGGEGTSQVIAQGHPLNVHSHDIDGGVFVAVTNIIYDTTDGFSVQLDKSVLEGRDVQILDGDNQWTKASVNVTNEGSIATLQFSSKLKPLESAFITIK
jgi:hypothetical protein